MRHVGRGLLAFALACVLGLGPGGVARVAAADVAVDDVYAGLEDHSLDLPAAEGVLANDTNDGGPALCVLSYGTGQGFVIAADGAFTFTPAPDTPGVYTTLYHLGSVGAGGACEGSPGITAEVRVNVSEVNDAPVIEAAANCDGGGITVAEDSGAFAKSDCVNLVSYGGNDLNGLAAWLVSADDPELFSSQPAQSLDDPWIMTFTPAPNANGSSAIKVRARDTGGTANGGVDTSETLSIPVTITPVNDAPTATADSFAALVNRTLNVNGPGVLSNDSDVDGDGLTAVKDSNPAHGVLTLAANGGFSYTPSNGYVGPDAFSYHATDGSANSPTRVVSLSVSAVPPSPTPVPIVTIAPPSPTPTAAPSAELTLPPETAAPSESVDPGLSLAPTIGPASAAPLPSPTAVPEPVAGEDGGISLPVLLTIVLLLVLLAFGAAVYVPRWLAARQGGPPTDDGSYGGPSRGP